MRKKIFGILYMLSFLCLIPLSYATEYISAQTWADITALVSAVCGIYMLVYIIWLRKFENVGLGRAIARFFLYLSGIMIVLILIHYARLYVGGYTPSDVFGNPVDVRKYGMEAVMADGFGNIVYIPAAIFAAVYQVCYFFFTRE